MFEIEPQRGGCEPDGRAAAAYLPPGNSRSGPGGPNEDLTSLHQPEHLHRTVVAETAVAGTGYEPTRSLATDLQVAGSRVVICGFSPSFEICSVFQPES